jgi:diguanylate cyclase (GGDEF)-like protein
MQDYGRKISLTGGIIFLVTALVGVFGGFAVLFPQVQDQLHKNLQRSLESCDKEFKGVIEQGWLDSFNFANQSIRVATIRMLGAALNNKAGREQIQKVAESSSMFGFSALIFRDSAGREITRSGSFVNNPELDVIVHTSSPSHLLWNNGFILRTHINVVSEGKVVGTMDAERPLSQLEKISNPAYLGNTTDFAICASATEETMHCFPFRSSGEKVLLNLPNRQNGQLIPMSYALANKTGLIHTKDYRGRDVIAAYAPMGDLGLGTVLKIDEDELYQPITSRFASLIALLLVLVAAGMTLLRRQVVPLVQKMSLEISERKRAEEQISFLAYHDALTGLPNRLLSQDRFEQVMAYADRSHTKAALIFLDLDNFKEVNDSHGHSIGDALLKEVAVRLGESVRSMDSVGRQGGDEFLIVLTELHEADAITGVVEKVLKRLTEAFNIEGMEWFTSASAGIVVYPDDGKDFESLLRNADTAMYQAKGAGRNTYRFFNKQMNVDAIEHLHMRNELGKALERSELVLHYQPQVDLASGEVFGAEALIRWNHPTLGMVQPGRFIPVAESSGLIVPLVEWILLEACRQAVEWLHAGINLVVAVNISAMQFKSGDLKESVSRALAESGLPANLLELELTESILIQGAENVLNTVRQIRALGVSFSIDDFGTGYSSLSYLKRFAVSKLKIDQSFVRDLATDPEDAAIVRAIISMAHDLNLRVIAEGVEREDQLKFLQSHNCDEIQGYFVGKPVPAMEFCKQSNEWADFRKASNNIQFKKSRTR